jgi:hypothetical protein
MNEITESLFVSAFNCGRIERKVQAETILSTLRNRKRDRLTPGGEDQEMRRATNLAG